MSSTDHDERDQLDVGRVSGQITLIDDTPERLRRLCLALPKVTEDLGHGMPTRLVRDKRTLVNSSIGHHSARPRFWCAAPPEAQPGP